MIAAATSVKLSRSSVSIGLKQGAPCEGFRSSCLLQVNGAITFAFQKDQVFGSPFFVDLFSVFVHSAGADDKCAHRQCAPPTGHLRQSKNTQSGHHVIFTPDD